MPGAVRFAVPCSLALRRAACSLPSSNARIGKNHRRQIEHGRFLRTAPATIADYALGRLPDHR